MVEQNDEVEIGYREVGPVPFATMEDVGKILKERGFLDAPFVCPYGSVEAELVRRNYSRYLLTGVAVSLYHTGAHYIIVDNGWDSYRQLMVWLALPGDPERCVLKAWARDCKLESVWPKHPPRRRK